MPTFLTEQSTYINTPLRQCDRTARVAAAVSVGVGALVLVGWQYDMEWAKRVLPHLVAMNPITAVAFILTGAALWLRAIHHPATLTRRLATGMAYTVTGIGLLKILAYLGLGDAGIDQLLYTSQLADGGPKTSDGSVFPNRMAPNTAVLFAITGLALILAGAHRGMRAAWAQLAGKGLSMVVAMLALIAIIGYVNDVTTLYRPTHYIPIALHTAATFLAIAIGIGTLRLRQFAVIGTTSLDANDPERRLVSMMENHIAVGFAAALLIVAVIGIVSYSSIRNFVADRRLNEHSHNVITTIADLSIQLYDIETGVRGYLATEREQFLQPYHDTLPNVQPTHTQLRNMTADNIEQQKRLIELGGLIARKQAILRDIIDLSRSDGFPAARHEMATSDAGRLIGRTRAILNDMHEHEEALLAQRIDQTARSADITTVIIAIGSLLAFAIVAGSGWLIRRDMALRRRVEAELRRTKAAADQANTAKSQFLANMSHEIRTPMTAIIGYADLLLDTRQSTSDRLNYVNTIRRNGEHLLSVVNDILDLSKIEAGKVAVEPTHCSPCRILSDVASLMRVRASEKGLPFHIRTEGSIPETIHTDPTRLRQILINLVGNAIKFTEEGWVRLYVRIELNEQGREMMRFDVIDTGIGMTEEQIGRLFQPFGQADCSTTRRFGGTGLGLSICKPLAEMLGGRIDVDSTPGRGSTFSLTIDPGSLDNVPFRETCHESIDQAQPEEPAQPVQSLSGRILLVDDGHDNRQLLSVYLRQAGAEVAVADNGQTGCDKAQAAMDDDRPFDLVLMDIQMPVLDGYGAAARLRAKGYRGPIIALTAHAMPEDRIKCLNAGFTDYLSKPIRRDELLTSLSQHLSHTVSPFSDADEVIRSETLDESIQPFLDSFVRQLPQQVARLNALLDQSDLDALAELVHNLKGTGGLYGFMPITDAATNAETHIKNGDSLAVIAEQIHELTDIIRRTEGYNPKRETLPPSPKPRPSA